MADLTRERIAELRREASQNTRPSKPVEWSLTVAEAQVLVAMASRCVSEETVRHLAKAIKAHAAYADACRSGGDTQSHRRAFDKAFGDFSRGCDGDLREAALDGEVAK